MKLFGGIITFILVLSGLAVLGIIYYALGYAVCIAYLSWGYSIMTWFVIFLFIFMVLTPVKIMLD